MKKITYYLIVLIPIMEIITGCVTEFIPETGTDKSFYVVEGMITDEPGVHTVSISRSVPVGVEASYLPVRGCNVFLYDGSMNNIRLTEGVSGTYNTPPDFKGDVGKTYSLYIEIVERRNTPPYSKYVSHTLRSQPVQMLPVPEIDSLYYEKVDLSQEVGYGYQGEGCRIYLNTSDPDNKCQFYRWNYTETWKVLAPTYQFSINRLCWKTNESDEIILKAVNSLSENRIERQPVKLITNQTDRLIQRYRIEVNQYSVSENEYTYWKNIEKIMEQTGGLYAKIPAPVIGNMYCTDEQDLQILGYFSASTKRSKTIYIDEYFKRQVDPYMDCTKDTIVPDDSGFPPPGFMEGVGISYWLIELNKSYPPFLIVTTDEACVDCTVNGSAIMPDDWEEQKSGRLKINN
jgi:hypothetical protein